jgi:hypothetical protein
VVSGPGYCGGGVVAGFLRVFLFAGAFFLADFFARDFFAAGRLVVVPSGDGAGVGAGVCARANDALIVSAPSVSAAVLRNFAIIIGTILGALPGQYN